MANFGLSDEYEYFEMLLDSLDTTNSPDASVSSLNWPLFYLGRPLNQIAGVKIIEAQIPFSYYVFTPNNNTFLLTVAGQVTNAVVTIPPGNYSPSTIVTMLTTQLNAALHSTGNPSNSFSVTLSGPTSSPNTGQFTFTLNTGNLPVPTSFTFGQPGDTGQTNPRLFLGFPAGTSNFTFVNGTGMVLNSSANLISGPNYLYINSQKIGQLANMYLPSGAINLGGGTNGPQIAKVPVTVQPGGIILWQDPDPSKFFDFENLVNFADVDFYLTLGNSSYIVDLNGLSFSLKLGILVNKAVRNDLMGGTSAAQRVYSRYTVR